VIVYSTSDYVLTGATRWIKGWRSRNWLKRDGKPVSNLDLWQELDRLMSIYRIKWVSSKGKNENRDQGLIEASHLAAAAIDLER